MADKDKKICKLVKEDYLKDDFKKYKELVKDSKYVCRKCGRTSKKEKKLCKAEEI